MPAPSDRVGGLLLTGGASTRLGRDKATLPWRGTTLARYLADELAAACAHCVEVGDGLTPLPAVRENPIGAGPLAAVLAGAAELVRCAGREFDSVIVLACDYPLVERRLLRALCMASSGTVIPIAGGHQQFGVCRLSAATITEAAERFALGERSFRWITDFEPMPESAWKQVAPRDVFNDIDTPGDANAFGIRLDP